MVRVQRQGPSFPLAHEAAYLAARSSSIILTSAEFLAIGRFTAQKKAGRTFASRLNASVARAGKQTLSNAFHIGYEFANTGIENPLYYKVFSIFVRASVRSRRNGSTISSRAHWRGWLRIMHCSRYSTGTSNDGQSHLRSWTHSQNTPWLHLGSSERALNLFPSIRETKATKEKRTRTGGPPLPSLWVIASFLPFKKTLVWKR